MAVRLKDRVRLLVDRYWQGSVNRASVALGVPQQTLNRIVTGQTPSPRAEVVSNIASACDVSADWLLTGKGDAPLADDEHGLPITGARIRLNRVLDRLEAGESLRRSVLMLRHAPLWAALLISGSGNSPLAASGARDASEALAETWAKLLETAIELHGARHVRRVLAANAPLVALGFTDFGQFVGSPESNMRAQLAKAYVDYTSKPVSTRKGVRKRAERQKGSR
jgi:transcriptional regulator with XRE-family HTH domain